MSLRAGAVGAQQLGQVQRMVLAVGQATGAGGRSGAGDQPEQWVAGLVQQAEFAQRVAQGCRLGLRHVAQQQALPGGEAQFAAGMPLAQLGEGQQLFGVQATQLGPGDDHAQAGPGLWINPCGRPLDASGRLPVSCWRLQGESQACLQALQQFAGRELCQQLAHA